MTTYVGKLFSAVSSALELNAATLTGAMDIIAVKEPDGTMRCTPFHARFGKLKLLKSREKLVEVWVNDVKTELTMKLGSAGEAYFLVETDEIPDPDMIPSPPNELADPLAEGAASAFAGRRSDSMCSPQVGMGVAADAEAVNGGEVAKTDDGAMSPATVTESTAYGYLSDSEVEMNAHRQPDPRWNRFSWRDLKETKEPADCSSPRFQQASKPLDEVVAEVVETIVRDAATRYAEAVSADQVACAVETNSETSQVYTADNSEREETLVHEVDDKANAAQGQDLNGQSSYAASTPSTLRKTYSVARELSEASGQPPMAPSHEDFAAEDRLLAFSDCRHLLNDQMSDPEIAEIFENNRLTYAEFATDPNKLHDPNLLFRLQDRLVDWSIAAPMIISMLAFGAPLDMDRLEKAVVAHEREEALRKEREARSARSSSWFGFRRVTPPVGRVLAEEADAVVGNPLLAVPGRSDEDPSRRGTREAISTLRPPTTPRRNADVGQVGGPDDLVRKVETGITVDTDGMARFVRKSQRPTQEQLKALPLKPGANTVTFVVVYNNQRVSSRIFLWPADSKIVVSDVDGTITRSDVLGHLLPRVGRDWSHAGVAGLYTKIRSRGYRLMYLTSRPIGQACSTRLYLDALRQEDGFRLPEGPVVMSPDRLVKSITREMIQRRPHDFKIAALREIREMWPDDYNPFYAGFGNRITDAISYKSVGIPAFRIFTVNPKGDLTVMNAKYEASSSYSNLNSFVDNVYPDIEDMTDRDSIRNLTSQSEFTSHNFWKSDLPEVDFNDIDM